MKFLDGEHYLFKRDRGNVSHALSSFGYLYFDNYYPYHYCLLFFLVLPSVLSLLLSSLQDRYYLCPYVLLFIGG